MNKISENILNLKGIPENFDFDQIKLIRPYEIKKFENSFNLKFVNLNDAEFFKNCLNIRKKNDPRLNSVKIRNVIELENDEIYIVKKLKTIN